MNDPHPKTPNHQRLLEKAMAQSAHGSAGADATRAAVPSIEELAPCFPDYQIEELIGQGGMGSVFRAVQKNLQRPVAIKILSQEFARDPELGERFLREARALATLNHPGILTVHDYGERDGTFFLITEFVDGVNLRQLMELGELSPAEALRIAPQMCTALQFAHERGVVHRDIKPENILIDTDGQVKIADFGLAKVSRTGDEVALTRNTAVLGTPHYMAPEQWQGARAVDHRADIYSLGVVIYEMLTGNLPLGNFDPPSQRGGVPRGLDAVVRRALAQQPENRYQHVREVQSDVERQAGNLNPASQQAAARAHSAEAPGAKLVKGPFVALAMVLLVVVTVGYLIFDFERSARDNVRFVDDMAEYHELMQEWIARENDTGGVGFGAPGYTNAVYDGIPPLPAPPAPMIDPGADIGLILVSVTAGCLLLFLSLGFSSIRRIRNGSGKAYGLHAAVITAWIVPFGAVVGLVCVPINLMGSGDLQVILGTALIGGVAYVGWRFVVWEVARQRALMEQGVRMAGGGWIGLALTLAIAAFGNAAAMPAYLPQANQVVKAGITPGATMAEHLVGKTREAVVDYLGPPLEISVSQNAESWAYKNETGELLPDALVFVNGRVASSVGTVVLQAGNASKYEPHLGQSVAVFVARYGTPTRTVNGNLVTELTFGNGLQITVRDGIVVGLVGK